MKKQILKTLRKQYLSDCNGTRTHNHLIRKRTLNHLAKLEAISNFDWNKAFETLSVDEKVDFLNKTLLNIFRNYIPNKKIKCDYRQPPWMTDNIKKSLKKDVS